MYKEPYCPVCNMNLKENEIALDKTANRWYCVYCGEYLTVPVELMGT